MSGHRFGEWLVHFVTENGGQAGTVHTVEGDLLTLAASHNIPPKVVELTRVIPVGKGMAGLAVERREPVQTCNLKDDDSGDVRPGARAVDARAAVALPVVDDEGQIRAVVGIAYAEERELPDEEIAALTAAARTLPRS